MLTPKEKENKLINFKEWDGLEINNMLLEDQKIHLEYKIMKSKCKDEENKLRERLHLVNKAIEKNNIEFNI